MKKLLLAAAAGALMAACAESPVAPTQKGVSAGRLNADGECRSGYVVAFDENGNPVCVPVDGFAFVRAGADTSRSR